MSKVSDLKQGTAVEVNGQPYLVKKIEVRNPSSRGASTLYKIRFAHLKTGQKLDESFKGTDMLKDIECDKHSVQFSYLEGEIYHFMNLENYEQYSLNKEDLDGVECYLTEGENKLVALMLDDSIIGIELPASINLEVIETAPGIKSASATSRTKPATLSTGLEVQVPEYIETGEVLKINTSTGKFMSRA